MMFRALLVFLFIGFTSLSFSQEEKEFNYKIEDFRNDEEFLVEDSLLIRFNGGEVTKKAVKKFESLKSCGIDLNFWYSKMSELPEEFMVFGQTFTYNQESEEDSERTYVSKEMDSELHFITFFYNEFREESFLRKIEIEAENVRSGETYIKYIYRFWEPR